MTIRCRITCSLALIGIVNALVSCNNNNLDINFEEEGRQEHEEIVTEANDFFSEAALQSDDGFEPHWFRIMENKYSHVFSFLNFNVSKKHESLHIGISFKTKDSLEFPEVWNSDFDQYETADKIGITLTVKSEKNKVVYKQTATPSAGNGSCGYTLREDAFKDLTAGTNFLFLTFSGAFESFFGVRGKEKLLEAKLMVPYEVPPVYKTTFYFKSMTLDKESTKKELGSDNDSKNSTPEPAIHVYYKGETLLYKMTENSYRLSGSAQASFYHIYPDYSLLIEISDHDYFLNPNDALSEVTYTKSDLEGDDYKKFTLRFVEELWMYTRTQGFVNSKTTP